MKPTLPLPFAHIAAIIGDELGVCARRVQPGALLDSFGCDSLHVQSVAVRCEETFLIDISDDLVEGWRCPFDVARTVAGLLAVREAIMKCGETA